MKRILQIIPAEKWEVQYSSVDGELVENDNLVCFALVEEDGVTRVEGMHAAEGFIDFCEDVHNFDSYIRCDGL